MARNGTPSSRSPASNSSRIELATNTLKPFARSSSRGNRAGRRKGGRSPPPSSPGTRCGRRPDSTRDVGEARQHACPACALVPNADCAGPRCSPLAPLFVLDGSDERAGRQRGAQAAARPTPGRRARGSAARASAWPQPCRASRSRLATVMSVRTSTCRRSVAAAFAWQPCRGRCPANGPRRAPDALGASSISSR